MRVPGPARRIVLGIDYGTTSTKVAFRDLVAKDRAPNLVDFGTTEAGFCRFALPSAVAVSRGKVVVGAAAERRSTRVWRAAKMAVLAGSQENPMKVGHTLKSATEAEFAAAMTIAHAVRIGMDAAAAVGDGGAMRWIMNLDVPVDSVERDEVADRFRSVLSAAVVLAPQLSFPAPLGAALELFEQALESPLPDEVQIDLVPEARALMQGLAHTIDLERGVAHAILDVGGGTTDIGVFLHVPSKDRDRMPFWSSGSIDIGCGRLDEALWSAVGGDLDGVLTPSNLSAIAAMKRDLVSNGIGAIDLPAAGVRAELTLESLDGLCSKVFGLVRDFYGDVFGRAYAKQKYQDLWRTLPVFVVGGGSLLPPVRQLLLEPPPKRDWVDIVPKTNRQRDVRCNVVGASDELLDEFEFPFVLPALGLSYAEPELPEFVPPSEVPDDPGRRHRPTGWYDVDSDDLYAK